MDGQPSVQIKGGCTCERTQWSLRRHAGNGQVLFRGTGTATAGVGEGGRGGGGDGQFATGDGSHGGTATCRLAKLGRLCPIDRPQTKGDWRQRESSQLGQERSKVQRLANWTTSQPRGSQGSDLSARSDQTRLLRKIQTRKKRMTEEKENESELGNGEGYGYPSIPPSKRRTGEEATPQRHAPHIPSSVHWILRGPQLAEGCPSFFNHRFFHFAPDAELPSPSQITRRSA